MKSDSKPAAQTGFRRSISIAAWALVGVAVALTTPLMRTEIAKQGNQRSETVLPASIRPHAIAMINSKFPGQVASINVSAGTVVKAGDALVTLSNRDFQMECERAKVHLQNVRERLGLSHAGRQAGDPARSEVRALQAAKDRLADFSISEAEGTYEQASANLKRLEKLEQQSLATEAELEEGRQVKENALRNLRADREHLSRLTEEVEIAQTRYDRTPGVTDEAGVTNLEMELREAEQELRIAQEHCDSQKILATIDGTVIRTMVNAGDEIPSGVPLLQLAQLDQLNFDVPVGAEVARSIKVGQTVKVRIPTEPPTHVSAPVAAVMLVPTQDQSAYTVRITLQNPSSSARLVGLTGEVEFPHSGDKWHGFRF